MKEYSVSIIWDDEAHCWCASENNLGVHADSGSLDALIEIVKLMIWDVTDNENFSVDFKFHRRGKGSHDIWINNKTGSFLIDCSPGAVRGEQSSFALGLSGLKKKPILEL